MATEQIDVQYVRAAKDLYYQNAGYDGDEDLDAAKSFVQACRQLLGLLPRRAQLGTSAPELAEFDLMTLKKELDSATKWMRAQQKLAATNTGWRQTQLYPNRQYRAGIDS